VETEIIEVLVRPVAYRAVAKRHHQAEQKIQRDQTYGYQADVSGKIDGGDHRIFGPLRYTPIAELLRDKIVFSGTQLG
jgi:hypothetical protein